MDEGLPLLLTRVSDSSAAESSHGTWKIPDSKPGKGLSMFFGVCVPNILSIFSVILFLRLGFIVGQAGYLLSSGMFLLAYLICAMTILSLSAISTNGAVKGGGVYFMISRSLGPAFGGSIGMVFFLANVSACGLYVIGLVESLVATFGPDGSLSSGLSDDRWSMFLYCSLALALCLTICLIGADFFAKATFMIFMIVCIAVVSVFVSFLFQDEKDIPVPKDNTRTNATSNPYTGFKDKTFDDNLYPDFGHDYTTSDHVDFPSVFAVLFNGCTGFMAGANMSGDLKNPSYAIPRGSIISAVFTLCVYLLLVLCISFTSTRELLQDNYGFLQDISLVKPLVAIGVFAATLSAALSTLIGSSRILQALARDDLFGSALGPFRQGLRGSDEPHYAVLLAWALVQCLLLAGEINTIAPIVSIFFLLAYGATNLACLALEFASTPNWRPTFTTYSWHTCLFGTVASVAMMFVINPLYSLACLLIVALLFGYVSRRSPLTDWGYISQALIYHQVRKYLLLLDVRKEHVKYWRPQLLHLVSNPFENEAAMNFVNKMKKGGLYMLGNVLTREFQASSLKERDRRLEVLLRLKDERKLKIFPKVMVNPSVRRATQALLTGGGLGGLHPNTLVIGYYDEPQQTAPSVFEDSDAAVFPPPGGQLLIEEYAGILYDATMLHLNVCVLRNFQKMSKDHHHRSIDVWACIDTDRSGGAEALALLVLQLAAIVRSTDTWKKCARFRVMSLLLPGSSRVKDRARLLHTLRSLRISNASVHLVPVENNVASPDYSTNPSIAEHSFSTGSSLPLTERARFALINKVVRRESCDAGVVFLGVPMPAGNEHTFPSFVDCIGSLSQDLPPTCMVFGTNTVTE
eukprot:m.105593 g.105593  ORF g.105593 m.105593 type:complete len:860 (+) comp22501_c0_seq4:38-2617(+)